MTENPSIQFVTDEAGNKRAVLIPIEEWQRLQSELQSWREYRRMRQHKK